MAGRRVGCVCLRVPTAEDGLSVTSWRAVHPCFRCCSFELRVPANPYSLLFGIKNRRRECTAESRHWFLLQESDRTGLLIRQRPLLRRPIQLRGSMQQPTCNVVLRWEDWLDVEVDGEPLPALPLPCAAENWSYVYIVCVSRCADESFAVRPHPMPLAETFSLPPCTLCRPFRAEADACCRACETWFCDRHGFPDARLCVGCAPEHLWQDHLAGSEGEQETRALTCEQKRNIALQIRQQNVLAGNVRRNEIGAVSLRTCNLVGVLPPALRVSSFPRSVQHEVPRATVTVPVLDLLKVLHPHERDACLEFDPESHVYSWLGCPTQGSVTALIKMCSKAFNPREAINGMRAGANWPRVGYLRPYMSLTLLQQVSEMHHSEAFLSVLAELPLPEERVVAACRQFVEQYPRHEHVKDLISLTDEEILQKWEEQRTEAAALGARMHNSIEAFLNCGSIRPCAVELAKVIEFVRSFFSQQRLTLYRTEWQVYASEERLAGSIDCVARTASGQIFCWTGKDQSILSSGRGPMEGT